jgi:2OG-Fe(II) oxygenase superfamily
MSESFDLKRKRSSSIECLRDSLKPEEGSRSGHIYLVSEDPIRRDKKKKGQSKVPSLQIEIPVALNSGLLNHEEQHSTSSLFSAYYPDSLFSDDILEEGEIVDIISLPANRTAPPIPGLYFEPSSLLLQELADSVSSYCLDTYFKSPGVNQVMLFTRFSSSPQHTSSATQLSPSTINSDVMNLNADAGLPNILLELLETISTLLKPVLPPQTYDLLFPVNPTSARQAIINLYHPGEGITPHIDLLGRYGDGIIGVSFNSSCVMRFDRAEQPGSQSDKDKSERWDMYLPERSIIVLSREARYDWTHGIDKKKRDYVSSLSASNQATSRPDTNSSDTSSSSIRASDGTWIDRGTRLSITFRWLLPGADVVGNDVS